MSDKDIELDYAWLTQRALRQVIHDVMVITAELGDTPGEHHFYIEFLTHADGVSISEALRETYPDRMTIILQHKFENLEVTDDHFEVTLHFKGRPDHLVIPFDAVTKFIDPHTEFALQFEPGFGLSANADIDDDEADEDGDDAPSQPPSGQKGETGSADVVRLDSFRKK